MVETRISKRNHANCPSKNSCSRLLRSQTDRQTDGPTGRQCSLRRWAPGTPSPDTARSSSNQPSRTRIPCDRDAPRLAAASVYQMEAGVCVYIRQVLLPDCCAEDGGAGGRKAGWVGESRQRSSVHAPSVPTAVWVAWTLRLERCGAARAVASDVCAWQRRQRTLNAAWLRRPRDVDGPQKNQRLAPSHISLVMNSQSKQLSWLSQYCLRSARVAQSVGPPPAAAQTDAGQSRALTHWTGQS